MYCLPFEKVRAILCVKKNLKMITRIFYENARRKFLWITLQEQN